MATRQNRPSIQGDKIEAEIFSDFLRFRQWKLQRERLQADFTKALDNFQRAQRAAAQKEKDAIKKYKSQGVGGVRVGID